MVQADFASDKTRGLLGAYAGRAIHDFLPAYQEFDQCAHGLCNAHHLRDLRFAHEELKQTWAGEMMAYLRRTKKLSDAARAPGAIALTQS